MSRAALPSKLLDTSDPRRPEAVRPFPGFKKKEAAINLPLYLSLLLTACTLLLRNRVYALPAFLFAVASIFNAESIFVESGFGPAQLVAFSFLAISTTAAPLMLDLTPKMVTQTPLPT